MDDVFLTETQKNLNILSYGAVGSAILKIFLDGKEGEKVTMCPSDLTTMGCCRNFMSCVEFIHLYIDRLVEPLLLAEPLCLGFY